MNKKFLMVLAIIFAVGCGIATVGWIVDDRSFWIKQNDTTVLADEGQQNGMNLTEFDSIQVDVLSANIIIEKGDTWNLAYNIPQKEKLAQCGVDNGTLTFKTTYNRSWRFKYEDWYVKITIPHDVELKALSLSTVSGNVTVDGCTFASGTLDSASGYISLSGVDVADLNLHSVSDYIKVSDAQVSRLTAETTSDRIDINGAFDAVSLKTVSGDCTVEGDIASSCDVETISGTVSVTTSHPLSVEAKTNGKIIHNGSESRFKLDFGADAPRLDVSSVSGKITITTKSS